jgi:iron uptake system component EfeO
MRRVVVAAAATAAATVLAACGSSGGSSSTGSGAEQSSAEAPRTVAVKLVDTGCAEPSYTVEAGKVSFEADNSTEDDAELEILAPGPSIVAEKDPIEAGRTATLTTTLPAGEYDLRCALGTGTRTSTLTVVGTGGVARLEVDRDALDDAVAKCRDHIVAQTALLQQRTTEFASAVESGDIEMAKSLYANARVPYESIEPVAELFPEQDAALDSRVDDHDGPDDPTWTGWHRLEKALWADNSTAGMAPIARQLVADTDDLATKVTALAIQPGVMTNGAGALIEEAASSKITGEEERYSHTDLSTIQANVDGAKEIVELVAPVLSTAPGGPALLRSIDARFGTVDATLMTYRTGDAFVTYDRLTGTDRDKLEAGLADLSEQLSRISGTMGLQVQ